MLPDNEDSRLITVPSGLDDDSLNGFFQELAFAIGDKPEEIALDCSLLEHATSRHINALWDALTRTECAGIPLRLTSVGYGLGRVLGVLDLAELFKVDFQEDGCDEAPYPPAKPSEGQPSERFEAEMDASIEAVVDVMAKLHAFLKQQDVSEIDVFDLKTVFYEVATNICRHSGLGDHRKIAFVAYMGQDEISFRFTDGGERFDPTGNTPEFDPRLAIRRRQSRGIGLVMIQRMMDSITYERIDRKHNVVTLRKRLAPRVEVVQ
jgi:anti-sigma regulatory factor (Ser/Thr protein kinase)/anti-anti-sigma regulatory factor